MNYFEFYDIPMSFAPDITVVKKKYYFFSKKYHPDFYTQDSVEKQMEALEFSSLNNKAFNTLRDGQKCMKYVLDEMGVLGEEGTETVPRDFLLNMMEINEDLMEAKMSGDDFQRMEVQVKLDGIEKNEVELVKTLLSKTANDLNNDELEEIKAFYLKQQYLKRLRNQLIA